LPINPTYSNAPSDAGLVLVVRTPLDSPSAMLLAPAVRVGWRVSPTSLWRSLWRRKRSGQWIGRDGLQRPTTTDKPSKVWSARWTSTLEIFVQFSWWSATASPAARARPPNRAFSYP